jgi:hypothetical protein
MRYLSKRRSIWILVVLTILFLAGNASAGPITIIGDAIQLWNKSVISGNINGNLIDDLNGTLNCKNQVMHPIEIFVCWVEVRWG